MADTNEKPLLDVQVDVDRIRRQHTRQELQEITLNWSMDNKGVFKGEQLPIKLQGCSGRYGKLGSGYNLPWTTREAMINLLHASMWMWREKESHHRLSGRIEQRVDSWNEDDAVKFAHYIGGGRSERAAESMATMLGCSISFTERPVSLPKLAPGAVRVLQTDADLEAIAFSASGAGSW